MSEYCYYLIRNWVRVKAFGAIRNSVESPASPVFPPCGHTASRLSLQYLSRADTSCTDAGLSTTALCPENQ